MKTIGVTGGIASGKSTVVRIIQELGYPVFFSDQEARLISETDERVVEELKLLFGEHIYSSGLLNRAEVARKVFRNDALLAQMSAIIHPRVRSAFQSWSQTQHSNLVFNEAAILFETGAYKNFDKTILVTAPLELRIQRAMKRDRVSREDVVSRITSQWTDEQKIPMASFVVQNDEHTPVLMQIEKIIQELEAYSTSS